MKTIALLIRITSIILFIQLFLGGLVTFGFINVIFHIAFGLVLLGLSILVLIYAFVRETEMKPIQRMSIGLVALIVIQAILGFYTLDTGSEIAAFVHFLVALAIYGLVISEVFLVNILGRRESGKVSP